MADHLTVTTGLERVFMELKRLPADLFAGGGWRREARCWSDMSDYFKEQPPVGDPLIYETFAWPDGSAATNLLVVFTVLRAGKIGQEHFHTKGHFHVGEDGSEVAICYAGEGILETAPQGGAVRATAMAAGTHVLIPAGHAHRMVNAGDEPVVFLSICSAGVDHDYHSVLQFNWRRRTR